LFCVICAHTRNASRSDAGGPFAANPSGYAKLLCRSIFNDWVLLQSGKDLLIRQVTSGTKKY
jgi:hypothetical protein